MTIGEKIQKQRMQLGLSQEELGKKLLVSRQTISFWENNQTVPTIDNLIRLKCLYKGFPLSHLSVRSAITDCRRQSSPLK